MDEDSSILVENRQAPEICTFRRADKRVGSPAIASREERPWVLLQRPYTDARKKETACD
jgi:hypothetical protein